MSSSYSVSERLPTKWRALQHNDEIWFMTAPSARFEAVHLIPPGGPPSEDAVYHEDDTWRMGKGENPGALNAILYHSGCADDEEFHPIFLVEGTTPQEWVWEWEATYGSVPAYVNSKCSKSIFFPDGDTYTGKPTSGCDVDHLLNEVLHPYAATGLKLAFFSPATNSPLRSAYPIWPKGVPPTLANLGIPLLP